MNLKSGWVMSLACAALFAANGCSSSGGPSTPGNVGGTTAGVGGGGGIAGTPGAGGGGGSLPNGEGSGGSGTGGSSDAAASGDGSSVTADSGGSPPDAAAPATDGLVAPPITDPGMPPAAGCVIKWAPNPMVEGEKAFEFLEMPDRNTSHPNAVHFSVVPETNAYRYDSHYMPPNAVDWDRQVFTGPMKNDRIRGEVRGMIGPEGELDLVNGQTWRLSWSLFIPSSLKGTGRFTHIHQLKFVAKDGDVSGSPIITLSLNSADGIYLHIWLGGADFPAISLAGLHDKWLWTEVGFQLKPSGATVHWTLKDGDKVLMDKDQTGNVTWLAEAMRARPKWGIYRGITDDLQTSYMMAKDYRAWLCP